MPFDIPKIENPHFVYLARCSDKSLYVGYCSNITKREKAHNEGKGAYFTRKRRPIKIIYFEKYLSEIEAIRRELQIKKWSRIKKENLAKHGHPTKF
ncbi:MAG: GIY-YIG nuclease family protein [bacterium]|nr:GIY-YIG nuclease family protein [bacterium]